MQELQPHDQYHQWQCAMDPPVPPATPMRPGQPRQAIPTPTACPLRYYLTPQLIPPFRAEVTRLDLGTLLSISQIPPTLSNLSTPGAKRRIHAVRRNVP